MKLHQTFQRAVQRRLSFPEVKFPTRASYEKIKKIVKTLCDLEGKNSTPFAKAPQQCTITGCKMFYGSEISHCALKDIKSKVNSSLNEF